MSNEPLTYLDVRKACCALLGAGESPVRPKVQDVLFEQIGRKGSNSVVQGFINQFWSEAADRMNVPARQVQDIPADYVKIVDRALVELVGVSRKMATDELRKREEAIEEERTQWSQKIQQAYDTAAASEQLRIRAEGEINGLQAVISELRINIRSQENRLADEAKQLVSYQDAILWKDQEIQRQSEAIEDAHRRLELMNESHRAEINRLLVQIDAERQQARKDLSSTNNELQTIRKDLDQLNRDNVDLREKLVRLESLVQLKESEVKSQSENSDRLRMQLAQSDQIRRSLENEFASLSAHHDSQVREREAAEKLITELRSEIAGLNKSTAKMEVELEMMKSAAASSVSK